MHPPCPLPQAESLATLVFNVTLTGVIGDASGQGRSLERATLVIETGEIRRAPITFLRRHLAPVSEEGFTLGGSYAVGESPPSSMLTRFSSLRCCTQRDFEIDRSREVESVRTLE